MLHTVILKNNYQDSINLMLLTNKINALDALLASSVNKFVLTVKKKTSWKKLCQRLMNS